VPYFAYEALDQKGASRSGKLTAGTEKEAVDKIKAKLLYPVKVYQILSDQVEEAPRKAKPHFWSGLHLGSGVSPKHFIPFINDLASLIDAGIPLVRSLTLLEQQTTSAVLKDIIGQIRRDVEDGSSFTDALKHHPKVFSPLFVNMVRSGEMAGILDQSLNRLASFAEKTAQLKARIQSAVAYPLVVLCFALSVVLFLVAYVVPKMFVIFADVGSDLPTVTVWLFGLSSFLRTRWYVIIGVLVVLTAAYRITYRIESVHLFWDRLSLRVPVFGPLAQKVALARFARTFATLTQSGVPILNTLSVVQDATGNLVFARALEVVRSGIQEGEGISAPLSTFRIFPLVVTNMIRVGEETGNLAEMLGKVANKYDEEVDITLNTLTSLLEPMLIIALGVVVGFIVISLFLPMVPLIQNLSAM